MKRTSTLEPPMTGLVFLYFGQTTGDTPSGQAVRTSHEEQPLYENSEIHLFVYLDAIAYHYNASSSLFAFSGAHGPDEVHIHQQKMSKITL